MVLGSRRSSVSRLAPMDVILGSIEQALQPYFVA